MKPIVKEVEENGMKKQYLACPYCDDQPLIRELAPEGLAEANRLFSEKGMKYRYMLVDPVSFTMKKSTIVRKERFALSVGHCGCMMQIKENVIHIWGMYLWLM